MRGNHSSVDLDSQSSQLSAGSCFLLATDGDSSIGAPAAEAGGQGGPPSRPRRVWVLFPPFIIMIGTGKR
jgi:hypothetical protein